MEREYRGQNPRGSEVTTEDSERKEIAEISDLGVQKAPSTESGTANDEISDLGVQGALSVLENVAGFKPMTVNTGKFTYDEVAVWFRTLSSISKCSTFYWCADEYAQRLVVDEEMNQGWIWLDRKKKDWLKVLTEEEYGVLERFGIDRGTQMNKGQMGLSPEVIQMELDQSGASVLDIARLEGQITLLKKMLWTMDDMADVNSPGVWTGSSAGDKTLEALMTSLQQMADEMRPGDGPLEARTPGIYHMAGGTNTDEVRSGETAGDETPVIKEHPEVCAKGSAGVGTPEGGGTVSPYICLKEPS